MSTAAAASPFANEMDTTRIDWEAVRRKYRVEPEAAMQNAGLRFNIFRDEARAQIAARLRPGEDSVLLFVKPSPFSPGAVKEVALHAAEDLLAQMKARFATDEEAAAWTADQRARTEAGARAAQAKQIEVHLKEATPVPAPVQEDAAREPKAARK